MKNYILILALLSLTLAPFAATAQDSFNEGWTFWSDSKPEKVSLTLPHDAMIEEQRVPGTSYGHHNSYFPGGVYHYEKAFEATPEMAGGHVTIRFGGVYRNARVSLNGKALNCLTNPEGMLGNRSDHLNKTMNYGYSAFYVIADGKLKTGKNIIRVDVDNSEVPNSRWYQGSGIFRPVTILVQGKDYIQNVAVKTLDIAPAKVEFSVLHTDGSTASVEVFDGEDKVAGGEGDKVSLEIPEAHLWSAESPYLYKAVVSLKKDGKVVDKRVEEFGVRTLQWSTAGFLVNGKQVLLRGGCIHHDEGILGSEEYQEAADRKIAILKSYGFNAIRSAHNPISEELLRACDRQGMYVMDELWDMWYHHKTDFDNATYFMDTYDRDIESFVWKDYNHPSVIMYSIGNEVTEPVGRIGLDVGQDIIDRLHELDPSRPVTAGINLAILSSAAMPRRRPVSQDTEGEDPVNTMTKNLDSESFNKMMSSFGTGMGSRTTSHMVDSVTSPILDRLDIAGYNYAEARYPIEGEQHPDRIVVGSETMPYTISQNWAMVEKYPYLIGDFMWTAWDYIGEVGLGGWYYAGKDEHPSFTKQYPWILSYAGAIDIIGNPTGEALLAKAVWDTDVKEPYIGVEPVSDQILYKAPWRGNFTIPSWSWRGVDGMKTNIEVYSNQARVRLYLNKKLVGEKEVVNHVARFEGVPYKAGTLKAEAISADGKKYSSSLVSATGSPRLSLNVEGQKDKDGKALAHKKGDVVYVDVAITGDKGIVIANDDRKLSVSLSGCELLGFGSANPKTEESYCTGTYTSYQGRALAVVRLTADAAAITVNGEGLAPVTSSL